MDEFEQESYRGKKKEKGTLTMKQIILEQVKRIMEIGSKEFRGGYQEETIITIDGQPQIIKKYIEDGRQAYCNAVLSLDVIASNYYAKSLVNKEKEKELLKGVNDVKSKMNELYKKYSDELKKKDIDKQQVKYNYLSNKRQLCQDLFSELILVIETAKEGESIDKDEQEENKYED